MGGLHSAQVPGPPHPATAAPSLQPHSLGFWTESPLCRCSEPDRVQGHRCVRAGQGPGSQACQSRAESGVTGVSKPGRVRGHRCPSRAGSKVTGVSELSRVRGHRCVRAGQGPGSQVCQSRAESRVTGVRAGQGLGTLGMSQPGRVWGPGSVLGFVWCHAHCAQLCALLAGGKGSGI